VGGGASLERRRFSPGDSGSEMALVGDVDRPAGTAPDGEVAVAVAGTGAGTGTGTGSGAACSISTPMRAGSTRGDSNFKIVRGLHWVAASTYLDLSGGVDCAIGPLDREPLLDNGDVGKDCEAGA
jgi:hypothetical protein